MGIMIHVIHDAWIWVPEGGRWDDRRVWLLGRTQHRALYGNPDSISSPRDGAILLRRIDGVAPIPCLMSWTRSRTRLL